MRRFNSSADCCGGPSGYGNYSSYCTGHQLGQKTAVLQWQHTTSLHVPRSIEIFARTSVSIVVYFVVYVVYMDKNLLTTRVRLFVNQIRYVEVVYESLA